MKTEWTFSTAYAVSDSAIYVACAADALDAFDGQTTLYQWSLELQARRQSASPWFYKSVDWLATSVTALVPEVGDSWQLCALSEDGDILFTGGGKGYVTEKIHDIDGRGYLNDLQQIGDHLFAAGNSGQVYKRLAPDQWIHFDKGIAQPAGLTKGQYAIQVINGRSEDAIYVAGCTLSDGLPVRASYWNGKLWRDLKLPDSAERITNMYVESDTRIWMCGANGTLLLGNAQDGFQSLSGVDDNQLFLSVCKFEEKIYLGSNLGLFVYKPYARDEGIQRVLTHMEPELQDANIVDAVDDVLWSIGPKDIARFNGHRWERIHHPDNPPIGGAAPRP